VHNKADAEYSVQMPDFAEWTKATSFVEKTGEADAWYEDNKVSVEEKKTDYLVKWNKMLPEERAELVLNVEDGV
jgi:hypothetical protein